MAAKRAKRVREAEMRKGLEAALFPLQLLLHAPAAGMFPGLRAAQVPVQQGPTQATMQ